MAVFCLQPGELGVNGLHIFERADFGDEIGVGWSLHGEPEVVESPGRVERIRADDALLAAEVDIPEPPADDAAGYRLVLGCYRVFEIQNEAIGFETERFDQQPFIGSRNEVNGAPNARWGTGRGRICSIGF